jgi:predicted AlkP superfamily pyrophosphatase or phosphodiesterase
MLQQAVNLLRRPRLGPALALGLHVLALSAFINGFLLTRVHLPQRAVSPTPAAVPYDRIVWLMIDALRYDFVVQDGRYSCSGSGPCHQGHMPFLSDLSRRQVRAGLASHFRLH